MNLSQMYELFARYPYYFSEKNKRAVNFSAFGTAIIISFSYLCPKVIH